MKVFRRAFLFSLFVLWLAVLLACGGTGSNNQKAVSGNSAEKIAKQLEDDEQTIREAMKARDAAISNAEAVRVRNEARKRQYEEHLGQFTKLMEQYHVAVRESDAAYEKEVGAFKKANLEYESLRKLDFALNFLKSESTQTKWYQDVIREYPGTEAAKEAQRRLAGTEPQTLSVPPQPTAPKQPNGPTRPIPPQAPGYEPIPPIPQVPTLADLQARHSEVAKDGKVYRYDPPTNTYYYRDSNGKSVHVSGYTRKDGTYVHPHDRRPPGSGASKSKR